jgi:uroporphyrinogen decarboxylase
LIDAGVQIINPVQISADAMNPIELKRQFGKDLVFWGGGANMQGTVFHGSLDDIRREVRELIEIFSKDSGFVFNQIHNIQSNVSPERIMAIYQTAMEYRR